MLPDKITYILYSFLDALKELSKAKEHNQSSSAMEEIISKLSEEKVQSTEEMDRLKKSELKLKQEIENLNNKYEDLETQWKSKDR